MTDNHNEGLTRRAVVAGGMIGAGIAAMAPTTSSGAEPRASTPSSAGTISASDRIAVATTQSGKVRGFESGDILIFKGIPYGANTGGENRFKPPRPALPWGGVRSSMQFGAVSPQPARTDWQNDETAWLFNWNDGIQGEDCLRVNIWTPGLSGKRAVMVWIHGGGFVAGSGQEQPGYDGANLARRGDVVVVSLNHRLGALGFLDLSHLGGEYASSGNVGMLDLVAALQWVHNNIAEFGGDPDNVTIFGQSGGGGKVGTLLAMPSARGLFHRAVIQSGSISTMLTREQSRAMASEVLADLGIAPANAKELSALSFESLVTAGQNVSAKRRRASTTGPDFRRGARQLGWAPVVDGDILPRHPFDPDAPPLARDIPLLVGSTLNEFTHALGQPELETMTEAEALDRLGRTYGPAASRIFGAARSTMPGSKPIDIYSVAATAGVRAGAIRQARLKAEQGGAPAYLYRFDWQTPVLDGRPRAFHCAEIAFIFDNSSVAASMTGGGERPQNLATKMSEAWIAFAKTGNPNHPGLPHWPAYNAASQATMIFDDRCQTLSAPDAVLQAAIAE